MKILISSLLLIVLIIFGIISQRHAILISTLGTGEPPPLLEVTDEPGTTWFDDYFTVHQIDSETFAIGEPRYPQQNFSYLILGTQRAILFDAGPGLRDIRPVVESLTELPLTFIPSHFHYDHIGNEITFTHVAVIDLPHIRGRAPDNRLTLTWQEHVGAAEGFELPTLEVDVWLQPGETLDLGGRRLEVVYTPGHTNDSISLLDLASGTLFSGDYLYPGPLYAFLPNSNIGDYLQATTRVLEGATQTLLGAHRIGPPGLPELGREDVEDLRDALSAMQAGNVSGSGFYPRSYPVNDRLQLLTEPGWLQDWSPTYPD